jgi:mono/diheme cytochrome c family protein
MPPSPQLPPESHYDPKKIGMLFAIASVVLLLSLIGLFAKDYSRQWKEYQRQFRSLEVEKTRVKMDEQQKDLSKNEEYQNVLKSLKEAQSKQKQNSNRQKQLDMQIKAADAVVKIHTQKSQFAKAKYDALKYKYDHVKHEGHGDASEIKNDLDKLSAEIERLRLKIEAAEADLKAKQQAKADLNKEVKVLERKEAEFAKKAHIIENKLKRIDTEQMSVANQIAEVVRDLPIIDLANPNYKIQQIVLKDIPEDVNFMKVQRVDRCTTCHLGIDNPDFKNAAQPYRSHPHLELFMDKDSPHPIEEFGCTTCHGGRGRATDFVSAAHTPRDEHQAEEWKKKYGWYELHHWDQPMFSTPTTEAGCFKCHENQTVIKGAEKLNLGLNLIEKAGCYNCHVIKKYEDWPKSGPGLEFLASKSTKEWAYHWIDNPKAIRPNTWMPSYFHQANNSDPESTKRGQQEIHAIVEYLFAHSKPYKIEPVVFEGDAKNGKELVSSLGCLACHQVEHKKSDKSRDRAALLREFGPNLIGMGSKTTKEWMFQWLKDPIKYHKGTRMPNMRLSDKEAADIAAYLMEDKSKVLDKAVPVIDEAVLNSIVLGFLKKSLSVKQSEDKLKAMDQKEKLVFAGERLIRDYGCFSCHDIPGFEKDKPIGVELTEEGSKALDRLDFGFIHIEHSKEAWFKQKVLNPRIFDQGKMMSHNDKLKMPNFNLSKAEAEAVTTALMGFVRERPSAKMLSEQGIEDVMVNEGAQTIRQFNCQSCHIINGEGGHIQGTVTDWLMNFEGKDENDAKAMTSSFSPPNLIGEGAKVQPQWLYEFIHSPTTIRPWLTMRMPTYYFHGSKINSIVKYFNYLDKQDFPFTDIYHPHMTEEELTAAQKLISKDYLDCTKCHVIGSQMPTGSMETWAPDFMLASKRLKPEWIVKWISNPPALQPGTKMPAFYDPVDPKSSAPPDLLDGDPDRQIKALRDYLLTISQHPPKGTTKSGPSEQPKKEEVPATQSK